MLATSFEDPSGDFGQRTIPSDPVAQVEQVEAEDEEGETEGGEEEEGGGSLIGDWWGLGEEAQESVASALIGFVTAG